MKIEIGTRKINVNWTKEMSKDLMEYHSFDMNESLIRELKRNERKNSLNRVKEKIISKNE